MRKKFILLLIVVIFVSLLTSCDQVKSLTKLIPKFDNKLPNNVAGKYASYETTEAKKAKEYTTLFTFTSAEGTFTKKTETEEKKGTYSVNYKTYAITECNGTINLNYESGNSESYEFYFYATATGGPEYIMLDDKTYYYEGI